jgi:molybdopterin synthase catalytic subunit
VIEARIVEGPLPPLEANDSHRDEGAELIFHGRVRETEGDREIVALDYEHYPQMAEAELRKLASETADRFPLRELQLLHRVGQVPVGQPSLRVVIWSKHRAEALEAMAWLIAELKQRVPIWKWAITPDGQRLPSHGH